MKRYVVILAFASAHCAVREDATAGPHAPGVSENPSAAQSPASAADPWEALASHEPAVNGRGRDELAAEGPSIVPRLIATIRKHIGDEDETLWQSAYDVLERLGTSSDPRVGNREVDAKIAELVSKDAVDTMVVEGVEFVRIPAGWFAAGTNLRRHAGIVRAPPLRRSWLDEFWISKYEVTRRQSSALGVVGGSYGPLPEAAEKLSWEHAVVWCYRFDEKIPAHLGLRCSLPTELQWEKACRGDFGAHYPWGFAPAKRGAFVPRKPDGTGWLPASQLRVGMFDFDRSPYGVVDMAGGVREWCLDRFEKHHPRPRMKPPVKPSTVKEIERLYPLHVVKGGDFPEDFGHFSRAGFGRSLGHNVGFRPVLTRIVPGATSREDRPW